MRFTKSGGQTAVGPDPWFTGTAYIDRIRNPDDQSLRRLCTRAVHPGCSDRLAHPPESPDVVRDRRRRVRRSTGRGGARDPSRDVVYIEPNEEHWHGATPERFMAHVAIQEADESGQVVTWGDHVTDQEFATR